LMPLQYGKSYLGNYSVCRSYSKKLCLSKVLYSEELHLIRIYLRTLLHGHPLSATLGKRNTKAAE